MKLSELGSLSRLIRPDSNARLIEEGIHQGEIVTAELVERESKYSDDGTRVVLNIKIEVENSDGETVDLYHSVNYSWGKKGRMIAFLEKLDALPKPGESLNLEELVGLSVKVSVENVEKDGATYSNVVNIRRSGDARNNRDSQKVSPKFGIRRVVKPQPNKQKIEELFEYDDDEIEDGLDSDLS